MRVISTVSGGSVLGAYYAYGPSDFGTFDKNVVSVLESGVQGAIAREVLFTSQFPKILGTLLVTGTFSLASWCVRALLSLLRRLTGLPTIEDRARARSGRTEPADLGQSHDGLRKSLEQAPVW